MTKQGKNSTKDTVATYLYTKKKKKKKKSLVQQVQTSLKAKEGLHVVLRLGRGTRRSEDGDKMLYVRSMRVSNPLILDRAKVCIYFAKESILEKAFRCAFS